mmetsp:Transcript_17261/g.56097  ORF Transcript_17261/g.56097 Transcript_17261/m.56097 type:complete len:207 (-) Transcript_17261:195-815(-)
MAPAASAMPASDVSSSVRRPARSMSTHDSAVMPTWMAMMMQPPRSRFAMPADPRMDPEKKMTALMPLNCWMSMTARAMRSGARTAPSTGPPTPPGASMRRISPKPTAASASAASLSRLATSSRSSSAARASSPPRSVRSDFSAASRRPRRASQDGVSGSRSPTATRKQPPPQPIHARTRHPPPPMARTSLPQSKRMVSWGRRNPMR